MDSTVCPPYWPVFCGRALALLLRPGEAVCLRSPCAGSKLHAIPFVAAGAYAFLCRTRNGSNRHGLTDVASIRAVRACQLAKGLKQVFNDLDASGCLRVHRVYVPVGNCLELLAGE